MAPGGFRRAASGRATTRESAAAPQVAAARQAWRGHRTLARPVVARAHSAHSRTRAGGERARGARRRAMARTLWRGVARLVAARASTGVVARDISRAQAPRVSWRGATRLFRARARR